MGLWELLTNAVDLRRLAPYIGILLIALITIFLAVVVGTSVLT